MKAAPFHFAIGGLRPAAGSPGAWPALPGNEAERLQALRRYRVLDTPAEPAFDRITTMAARLFGVPMAVVSLADHNRMWFKSCLGLAVTEISLDVSICAYSIRSGECLVVPDLTRDPRFASQGLVTGPTHLRFYAGSPLTTSDGFLLGTLCIGDNVPRPGLSAGEMSTLKELAAMAVDALEHRLALAEATAARERAGLLESVAVNANEAIMVMAPRTGGSGDPAGRILCVNRAFSIMSGYCEAEAIDRPPDFLFGPGTDRDAVGRVVAQVGSGQAGAMELLIYRKDGSELWIDLSAKPVADETGAHAHTVLVWRDIGTRRRDQGAMQAARLEAESANLAKSEFLARMSHELRTPLNSILGFAELLEAGAGSPERDARYLANIRSSGKDLLGLINDVLDLAKVEARQMAVSPAWFEVAPLLRGALESLEPLAAERGIELRLELPDAGCLCTDERILRQVVLNLVGNAIKFTPPGGVVELVTSRRDGEIDLRVIDSGPGIPPQDQERVFEQFEQLHWGVQQPHGSGLGLPLSRALVDLLGGRIWVESELGMGSSFIVRLPEEMAPSDRGLVPDRPSCGQ